MDEDVLTNQVFFDIIPLDTISPFYRLVAPLKRRLLPLPGMDENPIFF